LQAKGVAVLRVRTPEHFPIGAVDESVFTLKPDVWEGASDMPSGTVQLESLFKLARSRQQEKALSECGVCETEIEPPCVPTSGGSPAAAQRYFLMGGAHGGNGANQMTS
jgi:hypothetical protein